MAKSEQFSFARALALDASSSSLVQNSTTYATFLGTSSICTVIVTQLSGGVTHELCMPHYTTFGAVRQRIAEALGLPPWKLQLVASGHVSTLKDHEQLSKYVTCMRCGERCFAPFVARTSLATRKKMLTCAFSASAGARAKKLQVQVQVIFCDPVRELSREGTFQDFLWVSRPASDADADRKLDDILITVRRDGQFDVSYLVSKEIEFGDLCFDYCHITNIHHGHVCFLLSGADDPLAEDSTVGNLCDTLGLKDDDIIDCVDASGTYLEFHFDYFAETFQYTWAEQQQVPLTDNLDQLRRELGVPVEKWQFGVTITESSGNRVDSLEYALSEPIFPVQVAVRILPD